MSTRQAATFRPKGRRPVEVARFRRRLAASLIDGALISVVVALIWGAGLVGPKRPAQHYDWIDYFALLVDQHPSVLLAPLILAATIGVLYGVALRGWRGQTIGERALRLRVVDRLGHPIGPVRGMWRGIGTVLGLAVFLLGFAWAAVDPKRQSLADYLSGTLLLQEPLKSRN